MGNDVAGPPGQTVAFQVDVEPPRRRLERLEIEGMAPGSALDVTAFQAERCRGAVEAGGCAPDAPRSRGGEEHSNQKLGEQKSVARHDWARPRGRGMDRWERKSRHHCLARRNWEIAFGDFLG